MNLIIEIIVFMVLTYFIAGIPFAYVITKLFLKKDIRTIGSGNVGATNVYRAGGIKYAIPVFVLDFLKGFVPVLISLFVFDKNVEISILIAISAIIGHTLMPYLKFQGGKGAATSFGAFVVILPIPMLVSVVLFIIIVLISRMVALGTILVALILPIIYFVLGKFYNIAWPYHYSHVILMFISIIAIFIVFKHKSNIARIVKGKENKI